MGKKLIGSSDRSLRVFRGGLELFSGEAYNSNESLTVTTRSVMILDYAIIIFP